MVQLGKNLSHCCVWRWNYSQRGAIMTWLSLYVICTLLAVCVLTFNMFPISRCGRLHSLPTRCDRIELQLVWLSLVWFVEGRVFVIVLCNCFICFLFGAPSGGPATCWVCLQCNTHQACIFVFLISSLAWGSQWSGLNVMKLLRCSASCG